jgi:TRAP transporter TAXI family solute receptor
VRGRRGFVTAALVVLGIAAPAPADAGEPVLASIATGGKTGVYYLAGGAICDLVNERRWETGQRCLAEASDGSIANLRDVRSGARTFGIVQSDWLAHAVDGTGIFADADADAGPDREVRAVFGLFREPFTVVARPEAGILRFADLKDKRVSLGPAGSGGRATMGVVMQALGWTEADFAYVAELPMTDTPRALCAGEIDAAIFIVAHPNLTVEEMLAACGAAMVPLEQAEIDPLVAASAAYARAEIPGGTYQQQTSAVPTFAPTATLITSVRTPPAVVRTLATAVFEGLDVFRAVHPAFAALEPAQMLGPDLAAPLHEGVPRALAAAAATGPHTGTPPD